MVLAGKEYGSGSSRDWAAKGTALLGVKAVIAESYERIHRSNLIGMGVLPLQYPEGENAESLGLTGEETFSFTGVTGLNDGTHPADGEGDRPATRSSTRWSGSTPPARRTTTATAGSCSTSCGACGRTDADPNGLEPPRRGCVGPAAMSPRRAVPAILALVVSLLALAGAGVGGSAVATTAAPESAGARLGIPRTYDDAVKHFENAKGDVRPMKKFVTPSRNIYCSVGVRRMPKGCEINEGSIRDPAVCSGNPVSKYVGRVEFQRGRATPVCNTDTIRLPGAKGAPLRIGGEGPRQQHHLPERDHRESPASNLAKTRASSCTAASTSSSTRG